MKTKEGSYRKKIVLLLCFMVCITSTVFSEAESLMDLCLYASTKGEMMVNFIPQWKFPFLQGNTPLTSSRNIVLKLDACLSTMSAGLTGDVVLAVFPFLSFNVGAVAGTGWNYDLFDKVHFIGLGLNRKTNADDLNEGVIGNGFDGIIWNTHLGTTLQFDLAAFFPGDWNHVIMRMYNEIHYLAYTKAHGDDLWYYLCDDGMNQNSFRYYSTLFIGYSMPIFVDLVGVQFSGTLPFYNNEIGGSVSAIGFSSFNTFLVNFRINTHFSIMTLVRTANFLKSPITSNYEREWVFDRVQFIATWHIK